MFSTPQASLIRKYQESQQKISPKHDFLLQPIDFIEYFHAFFDVILLKPRMDARWQARSNNFFTKLSTSFVEP